MKIVIQKIRRILLFIFYKESLVRKILKKLYISLPRRYRDTYILEKVLKYLSSFDNIRFIQIGMNDGIDCDPIFNYVRNKHWNGLMIEPNSASMVKLKLNHKKSNSNLIFLENAIGHEGEYILYWCHQDPGISSTSKSHVIKGLNGKSAQIFEETVNMISFESLIRKFPDFSDIDLLLIDTEGWDYSIINSINFSSFKVDVIVFENAHMNGEEFISVDKYLKFNNFEVLNSRSDTVAINRLTKKMGLLQLLSISHKL